MRYTFTLITLFTLLFSAMANAQAWTVSPDFSSKKASREISGAVCFGSENWCLIVNDDKNYGQFFQLQRGKIVPQGHILLLPKHDAQGRKFKQADIESIAYSDGFVYIAGSHGLSKKSSGEIQPSRFFVYRFAVDKVTGAPGFAYSKKQLAPEISRSTGLHRELLRTFTPYIQRPLADNGVNIEGMAVVGNMMYFGFRAPVLEGKALVLSVSVSCIFRREDCKPDIVALQLGPHAGIRDLVAVQGGFLLLSGASFGAYSNQVTPKLWFWNHDKRSLRRIMEFGPEHPKKPEALLVLEQQAADYQALVFFDGPRNGAPYEINFNIEP